MLRALRSSNLTFPRHEIAKSNEGESSGCIAAAERLASTLWQGASNEATAHTGRMTVNFAVSASTGLLIGASQELSPKLSNIGIAFGALTAVSAGAGEVMPQRFQVVSRCKSGDESRKFVGN